VRLTKKILSTEIIRPSDNITIKPLKVGENLVQETVSPYGFAGAWNQFGFAVRETPRLIGHTGGTTGAGALFVMSPDNKYTIIILSNNGTQGQIALYQKIRDDLGFKGIIKDF